MKKPRKRLIYSVFNTRFGVSIAESKEWFGLTPVGREFGSKDYERLAKLDSLIEYVNFEVGPIEELRGTVIDYESPFGTVPLEED